MHWKVRFHLNRRQLVACYNLLQVVSDLRALWKLSLWKLSLFENLHKPLHKPFCMGSQPSEKNVEN